MTLRIAVPDGALRAPSLQILAAVGVPGGEPGAPEHEAQPEQPQTQDEDEGVIDAEFKAE